MANAEQGRRFELSWQAPANCPAREEVVREIDDLVAGYNRVAPTTNIDAHASIANDPGGFLLALSVRDAEGLHERKLEAPSCEELGHAAALIVALAINPALLTSHPDPASISPSGSVPSQSMVKPSLVPASEPPVVPLLRRADATAAPSIPTPSDAPTKSLKLQLGLSEFVAYRTLPGTNLGTGAFGAIQIHSVRLQAMVSGLLAEARASKPGAVATFALYRFATNGCWLVTRSKWSVGPCAGVELGLLRGHGYGVQVTNERRVLWFASSFGMLLEFRATPSSLFGIIADAEVPWARDEFELSGTVLFRPRVAARLGANLSAGW